MKICLIYSNDAYVPEINYICKLFGSLLKIEFNPCHISNINSNNIGISIGYCEVDKYKLPNSCRISIDPDHIFWHEYLNYKNSEVRLKIFQNIKVLNSNPSEPFLKRTTSHVHTNLDVLCSAFFIISMMEEINYAGERDPHGRYNFSHSVWSKFYIDQPLINIYAYVLLKWIEEAYEINISPINSLSAVISHDIDSPSYFGYFRTEISEMLSSIRSIGKYKNISDLINYITHLIVGQDPYDTFEYIQKQEDLRRIKSTYFIMLSNDNKWGLDLEKYSRRLKKIASKGNELALHPGYGSFCHSDKVSSEKKQLESISGIKPLGVRNHFLRFQIPFSYQICQQLDFLYDSTLGYPDREGFRTGICTPYKPFDIYHREIIELMEIPLIIMDGTLKDYSKYQPNEALHRIKQLIDTTSSVNGTIVFNWHNSFLSQGNNLWRSVFEKSLDYLVDKDARFYTCKELSSFWNKSWK